MADGQGYDAGSIFARLIVDKGQWSQAVEAVKNDQKALADVVAAGNVPLNQFGDLLKKYGVDTAQDARQKIADLCGDQVKLDEAYNDGIIGLGGYQKATKDVQDQLSGLRGEVGETDSQMASMFGTIFAGVTAANLANKAISELKSIFKDAIEASSQYEEATVLLNSSFITSGRNMPGMVESLKDYTTELSHAGLASESEGMHSEALLLRLTHLNEEGIKTAMQGAVGLAKVYTLDLQSATEMVGRAMDGQYMSIGRLIPSIRNAVTDQDKHAALMVELARDYKTAVDETDTYSGSVKKMNLEINEAKRHLGDAILSTGIWQAILHEAAYAVEDLTNELTNYKTQVAETAAQDKANQPIMEATAKLLGTTKSQLDAALSSQMHYADGVIAGEQAEVSFIKALDPLNPLYIALRAAMEGVTAEQLKQKKAFNDTGIAEDTASASLKKLTEEMRANITAISGGDFAGQIANAKKVLDQRLADIAKETKAGVDSSQTVAMAKAEYSATVLKISQTEADSIVKLQREADQKILVSDEEAYAARRKSANDTFENEKTDYENLYGKGTLPYYLAVVAAAQANEAALKTIDNAEMTEKQKLLQESEANLREDSLNIKKVLDERQAERQKLADVEATLDKHGLDLELANIKKAEDAEILSLHKKSDADGIDRSKEIAAWKKYYAELGDLAKKASLVETLSAAWDAASKLASTVLSNMSSNSNTFYANQTKQNDDYYTAQIQASKDATTKQLSDLDDWYNAQKTVIENSTDDDATKTAKENQLDADYAAKQKAINQKSADDQAKLAADQAAKDLEYKKKAFEDQKKFDEATAWMDMAGAIISAAKTQPFIPLGLIAAAEAAAMGAIQISNIESRQMPLAQGAVFTQPTPFYTAGGGSYVAGDDGMELMVGEKAMRSVMRSELGGERNRGAKPVYHLHFDIGGKEVQKFIIDTGQTLGFDGHKWKANSGNLP